MKMKTQVEKILVLCVRMIKAPLQMSFCNYCASKRRPWSATPVPKNNPIAVYSDGKATLCSFMQKNQNTACPSFSTGSYSSFLPVTVMSKKSFFFRAFTCRLMKLDVVSEDVLPSDRLKRLLRLGNFLGSCDERGKEMLLTDRGYLRPVQGLQPSKDEASGLGQHLSLDGHHENGLQCLFLRLYDLDEIKSTQATMCNAVY